MLCYPLCASLTLITAVIEDPSEHQAPLDVSLVGEFVRFLERLKVQEGCDVQRILEGCSRLRNIAASAADIQGDTLLAQENGSDNDTTRGMCEVSRHSLLLLKGTMCTDYLIAFSLEAVSVY